MFRVTGKTHPGAVREHNEDAFFCDQDQGLAVVADGMGGYAAGEVASAIVVETLVEIRPQPGGLVAALVECHHRIVKHSQTHLESKGMGAAVVAASFNRKQVAVCWAGDARAYLYHPAGGLEAVSRDHSYVQWLLSQGQITETQARVHPDRNLVTQCLGINPPQPELTTVAWSTGDTLLLCSDGLTDELDDAAIADIMQGADSAESAIDQLIAAALTSGGKDNITVVLAENISPLDLVKPLLQPGARKQRTAKSDTGKNASAKARLEKTSTLANWLPIAIGVGMAALLVIVGGALLLLKN